MQLLKLHLRPVHKLTEAHFCPSHYAWETVLHAHTDTHKDTPCPIAGESEETLVRVKEQTVAQAPQRVKVADSASER